MQQGARIDSAFAAPVSISQNGANTVSTPTAVPTQAIPLPLNHPQWQDAFAARIAWQAKDGLQHVSLNIHPAELGPVEVRLSVKDGDVNAQFSTAHGNVRQVIEDALPKLREILSQSGLNLANANVFQQAPGRDDRTRGQAMGNAATEDGLGLAEVEAAERTATRISSGLIDAYI